MNRTNPFITDEEVAKILALLESGGQAFKKYAQHLTPQQRSQTLKMRPGGEPIIALVVDLARQQGLQVADTNLDDIEAQIAMARRIEQLQTAAQALTETFADRILHGESEAWAGMTLYYSLLDRIAQKNPRLRSALKPAKDFFARKSDPVKQARTLARAERKAALASEKAALAEKRAAATRALHGESLAAPGATAPAGPNGVAKASTNGVAPPSTNGVHVTA